MTQSKKAALLFFSIVGLGAFLRFWAADWGLPYQYQTEEYRVIKYALKMGGGDLNPHIFEYPSLYLYFMLFLFGLYYLAGKALGFFATPYDFALDYVRDPTALHLIGRITEGLFGVGILLAVYHIGKKVYSRTAGLVACFIIAIIPYFVEKAHNTKGDMAAILLGLLFWNSLYEILKNGKTKHYYLAGALLGMMLTTKYYMAMLGIGYPLAHIFSERRAAGRHFFLALILVPLFFVLGTPYSILSSEFFIEFKSVLFAFGSGGEDYWSNLKVQTHLGYLYRGAKNFVKLYHARNGLWFINYGFGMLSLAGMLLLIKEKRKEYILMVGPAIVYWAVVGSVRNPDVGYFMPLHPILALAGGHLMAKFLPSLEDEPKPSPARRPVRWVAILYFCIAALATFRESCISAYMYGLKDTRTLAKEWIDQNIPAGSKVLLDLLPFSPPLEMTPSQLEKFYKIAVEENNIKAEYLKLKLQAIGSRHVGYEIFLIRRLAPELGVLPKHLAEVQKLQDLIDIQGDESDFAQIKAKGIRYFIYNSWSAASALNDLETRRLSYLYRGIESHGKLLKHISVASPYHPGPDIKVYELTRNGAR